MRQNNKGFTILEVMIVVAILAILATAFATSYGLIYSGNAKKAANDFYSLMNTCRVNTLNGANDAYIELVQDGDVYVARVWEKVPDEDGDYVNTIDTEQEISKVEIAYTRNDVEYSLGSVALTFAYDRETGEVTIPTETGSTIWSDGTDGECTLVTFTSGTSEYSVKINWQTGYVEVVK